MTNNKDVKVGGNMSLPIKEFQLETMCENPAFVMISKRTTGISMIFNKSHNNINNIDTNNKLNNYSIDSKFSN